MSAVVWAGATSHVGAIVRDPHAASERSDRLHTAWDRMATEIRQARLDALVVAATDHYETFGLEHYPTFCVGIGDRFEAWAEFGNPAGAAAGAELLAADLLDDLVSRGFDVSRSHELRLDHSFMVPLVRLGLLDLPVVPLFVNCNTPPLPTLRRCHDLGAALATAVRGLPGAARVGVLGTGGISHWVGLPRFGDVNADWDARFLDLLGRGDVDQVLRWSDDEIAAEAGNGALEIRTWLLAKAAAETGSATLLGYAPMPEWAIGIGIMSMAAGP